MWSGKNIICVRQRVMVYKHPFSCSCRKIKNILRTCCNRLCTMAPGNLMPYGPIYKMSLPLLLLCLSLSNSTYFHSLAVWWISQFPLQVNLPSSPYDLTFTAPILTLAYKVIWLNTQGHWCFTPSATYGPFHRNNTYFK